MGRERISQLQGVLCRARGQTGTGCPVSGLGWVFLLLSGLSFGQQPEPSADDPAAEQQLDAVQVQATRLTPAEESRQRLQEVPGGASLVDSKELARGRNTTLGDVLAHQPGVFVQSVGGNDAAVISIRGSGRLSSPGYFREGIKFLYDGLALTGTGGTTYEFLNAIGVDHTEILRGGNAFDYGALAIGGAVNFVTHTGYTAPGQRLRYETGSWGLQKAQYSYGGARGGWDYYVNLDKYRSDGYQHTLSKSSGALFNLGYRFSDKLDGRFLLRYRDEFHEDPAPLTLNEIKHDASQGGPEAGNGLSGRRRGSVWSGAKLTYSFDDGGLLEGGLAFYKYPHANNKDSREVNPGFWNWHDLNASLRYSRIDDWGGHESRSSLSFTSTQHLLGEVRTRDAKDRRVTVNRKSFRGSADRTFTLGNDLQLVNRLWLTSGLSADYVKRNVRILYSNRTDQRQRIDYGNWSLAPRIGVRYELTPELQLFSNFTRSIDPPLDWRYASPTDLIVPLVEQKANTFELGIKGQFGVNEGSLALYRSWLRDELLTVVDEAETQRQGAIVTATANSPSKTLHQGVELGLDTKLWEGGSVGKVSLRQDYTYNDFRYRGDPTLGHNRLPGAPEHVYQAQLEYAHPRGFYAGINAQAQSRTPVDYSNTLYAPSYVIWGAKLGFQPPNKAFDLYLDLRNLTDKNYAATLSSVYDAAGSRDTRSLYAGDGFGAFTGVEVRF